MITEIRELDIFKRHLTFFANTTPNFWTNQHTVLKSGTSLAKSAFLKPLGISISVKLFIAYDQKKQSWLIGPSEEESPRTPFFAISQKNLQSYFIL